MGASKLKVCMSLLLWSVLISCTNGFELVDQSGDLMIAEGSDLNIFCESDSDFEFCRWTSLETEKSCSVTKDQEDPTTCVNLPRIQVIVEENRCSLTIPGIERAFDTGSYRCTMVRMEDTAVSVEAEINVDIATPASVRFEGVYGAEEESISVKAGEVSLVECHVNGGYPDPEIQVALGLEEGVIDQDNDLLLEEHAGIEDTRTILEDGTTNLIKLYTFMPSMEDCGKFVKCEAVQYDGDGNLLFEANVQSRKIMVTFPPQPSNAHLEHVYEPGQEEIQVDIIFMANPVPENNQAIWHISPTGSMTDAKVLEAGQIEEGKYEALALNITDHEVIASLIIYNLNLEDAQFSYSLEVQTDLGQNSYPFLLQDLAAEEEPTTQGETDGNEGDVDAAGIGAGSIAGICIVVVCFVLLVGLVFWAKANDKICFKPFDPQSKEKNKNKNKSDPEAGVDEPLRQVDGADDHEPNSEELQDMSKKKKNSSNT